MNIVGGVLAIVFRLAAAGLSGAAVVQGKATFVIGRPLTKPTVAQIREGGIFGLSIGVFAVLLGFGWIIGERVGYVLISGGGGVFLLSLVALPIAAAVRSTCRGSG